MFGFLKKKVEEFTSKITKKTEEKLAAEPGAAPSPHPPEEDATPPKNINPPAIARKPEPPAHANTPSKPSKKGGLSLTTKIQRAVIGEVSLSEEEINSFLWGFELALLEADVAQTTTEKIISNLKIRLSEKKFKKGMDIALEIRSMVRDAIKPAISIKGFSIPEKIRAGNKPFAIMFLGPNGAGKTTTLAKIASMLKKEGISSIFAASDTFRAASMEQLQHHANALGIRMIRQDYGSDPAAVAYDAINSAKAKGIDCVLIDTAGRQETNKNLMEELKKIKRVAKPQLLIYVDEALAGNALVGRIKQFQEEIGVDGAILSKMDMDVKGGGAISIASATDVPVIYYGIGQSYDDLIQFNPDELLKRIFD